MPCEPLRLRSESWATRRCGCRSSARRRRSATASRWRSTRARRPRCSPISRSSRAGTVATSWRSSCGPSTRPIGPARRCGGRSRRCASALGGRWLAVARDSVSLERDGVLLDVDEFRRLAGGGDLAELERAAALQRGVFLAGFGLRDSAPFDDWQSLQAGTLARELGAVLDRLAEGLGARGSHVRAIEHARRRLALEPLNETAHRRLIELYGASGERAAALAPVPRVRSHPPSRARRGADRGDHGGLPRGAGGSRARGTRAGRARASSRALAAPARRPRTRSGLRCSISTEPSAPTGGSSSSRARPGSARPASPTSSSPGRARRARRRRPSAASRRRPGSRTAAPSSSCGECCATATRPRCLRARPPRRRGSCPSSALRRRPSLDGPGAQARFLDGVSRTLLEAVSGERPGVLVVDDAHWADASSLEVLAFLAHRLAGRPLLLVLDLALGGGAGRASGAAHPRRRRARGARRGDRARPARPRRRRRAGRRGGRGARARRAAVRGDRRRALLRRRVPRRAAGRGRRRDAAARACADWWSRGSPASATWRGRCSRRPPSSGVPSTPTSGAR